MKNEVLVLANADEFRRFFKDLLEQEYVDRNQKFENDEMNQRQAAAFIGVSEATIIKYKKEGKIPYEQLPGSKKVRYYKSELKRTLGKNRHLLQPSRK
ncbi:hypothetical protein SAMN05661096_03612 [Marivirga sericea]|uniref:Helix-turn-helix domain-containing protein n=1 Tax=Marivirga sericea TaxID=1028 RepID=A0A1X7L6G2_9BACT|nr:hypothetical protein [Marivirga sericea]SMG49436.1 hypothetical protein SAMN05661096_03612 [Marivirga sericea]